MTRDGRGWYNDSARHALARKGIKTASMRKAEPRELTMEDMADLSMSIEDAIRELERQYRETAPSTKRIIHKLRTWGLDKGLSDKDLEDVLIGLSERGMTYEMARGRWRWIA